MMRKLCSNMRLTIGKEHMLKTLDECIERLKERKVSLSKEFDDRLAEYKSYRDKVDTEVRKLENCRKIQLIQEFSDSFQNLKKPEMLKFECETNIVFEQIDSIGKLVENSAQRDYTDRQIKKQIDNGTENVPIEVKRIPFKEISPSHPYYPAYIPNKSSPHCNQCFQRYNEIHFSDNPANKFYNDLSIMSPHALFIDGRYWDSAYIYFRARECNYQKPITTEVSLLL